MELKNIQIEELKENYGVDKEIIFSYLNKILNTLKKLNINAVNEDTLYECLEYCCDKDNSNEFTKELLGQKKYDEKNKDIKEEEFNNLVLKEDEIVKEAINEYFSEYLDFREETSRKI